MSTNSNARVDEEPGVREGLRPRHDLGHGEPAERRPLEGGGGQASAAFHGDHRGENCRADPFHFAVQLTDPVGVCRQDIGVEHEEVGDPVTAAPRQRVRPQHVEPVGQQRRLALFGVDRLKAPGQRPRADHAAQLLFGEDLVEGRRPDHRPHDRDGVVALIPVGRQRQE
jgi:hypothetical protein